VRSDEGILINSRVIKGKKDLLDFVIDKIANSIEDVRTGIWV
jgi:hypothetical protein